MNVFLIFMACRNLLGVVASFLLSRLEGSKSNTITGYACLALFFIFVFLYLFGSPLLISVFLYAYVFLTMGLLILTKAYINNKLGFYAETMCCIAALILLIV